MSAPAPIVLGVDGGGTKTSFLLLRADGAVLAEHRDDGAYHVQIGMPALRVLLAHGVAAVLSKANLKPDEIAFAFFGLPAFGEDSRLTAELEALPANIFPHHRFACGNDMVSGWAGAFGGADGINIVSGTGSIAYGELRGATARAGGWGELFSDEGSAYWIAVQGLNAFSRMADGRRPKGPLYGLMRESYALHDDLDLSGLILSDTARDKIADASKIVTHAANAGDDAAREIFAAAAAELADLAIAVRTTLGYGAFEPTAVSYSGGVFTAGGIILDPLRAALTQANPRITLTAPRFSPSIGAALIAARHAGVDIPLDRIESR
ncbi:MAG: BadF/BadG/BcrA/BcrD ATPase family protein [Terricaulis sp.]